MESVISTISQLVTGAITWTTSWLTLISSNDILVLFCIALPLVGLGIGLLKRLVRVRA